MFEVKKGPVIEALHSQIDHLAWPDPVRHQVDLGTAFHLSPVPSNIPIIPSMTGIGKPPASWEGQDSCFSRLRQGARTGHQAYIHGTMDW